MAVELRDDRTEERDIILFDLIVVGFVGDAQAQRRAVEFQRYDRLEPLFELLRRNAGFDRIEAILPYLVIGLCIGQHEAKVADIRRHKGVNKFVKISSDSSWKISFFHYGK